MLKYYVMQNYMLLAGPVSYKEAVKLQSLYLLQGICASILQEVVDCEGELINGRK